ncbi:MAG TPA: glycosyltransferase family 25 protein [Acidocella sp.]|nr:glycosyltransferase family 25 protein [Acidocella sp.]
MRVYVINLDRHVQRWERMQELLQDVDLVRIPACDGTSFAGPPKREKFPRNFEDLTRFERACFASHALAWDALLASGASHACILEDDVVLSPDFSSFVASSAWVPENCDVVKLETFSKKTVVGRPQHSFKGRDLVRLYAEHLGAAGYIVSRRGAEKLRAHAVRPNLPVDHLLFDVPSPIPDLRILQLVPALCVQLWQTPQGIQGAQFESSIQSHEAFKENKRFFEKIIWEITRPWRQVVDFFQKIPGAKRLIDFQ